MINALENQIVRVRRTNYSLFSSLSLLWLDPNWDACFFLIKMFSSDLRSKILRTIPTYSMNVIWYLHKIIPREWKLFYKIKRWNKRKFSVSLYAMPLNPLVKLIKKNRSWQFFRSVVQSSISWFISVHAWIPHKVTLKVYIFANILKYRRGSSF